jgi:uncharacterized damage-inducible protein DinB
MDDANDPKQVLLRYLQRAHDAAAWKLSGLSEYDLRRPMTATGTNLLGVVKHLAMVELGYLGEVFGRVPEVSVAWFDDDEQAMEIVPNIDMYAGPTQTSAEVLQLFNDARRNTAATVAALDLDAPGTVPWWGQRGQVTLQRILVHMIEETARHTGQLDILREQLDGAAGVRADNDNLADFDADGWAEYRARLQAIADGFKTDAE